MNLSDLTDGVPFHLVCPNCRKDLGSDQNYNPCSHCGQIFQTSLYWLDLCVSKDNVNDYTEAAYKIYSKYYAPVALLVYLIIWRGNIFKHIQFFRDLIQKSKNLVDLATGDGSLTSLALFKSMRLRANKILAIDISGNMLLKAKKKLPHKSCVFVRGDVMQLPLADRSVDALSCFGGLNSFPSGVQALGEAARVLKPDGVLRGSVLLMPEASWRRKLVMDWIQKGYQTEEVDLEKFNRWVKDSGLEFSLLKRHGDVLLFELRHPLGTS